MIDDFDRTLLNELQRDDSRTVEQLAAIVPLSGSAIARRLRRFRREGWIRRSIALLSPRFTEHRARALVLIVLGKHPDRDGQAALEERLNGEPAVQFCYAVTGSIDLIALFDCPTMADFVSTCDRVLIPDGTIVERYEAYFVRREMKFEPFVELLGGSGDSLRP